MYFPIDNTKLESFPREDDTSLGDDSAFMLQVKQTAGLPADESWTELDANLKMYLNAAEDFIDNLVVLPYRPTPYILHLSPTSCSANAPQASVDMRGRAFSSIKLPKAPVLDSDITVEFLEDDDVTYTECDTWRLVGGSSLSPEILFSRDVSLPNVIQPFPVRVSFTTSANQTNALQKMAILILTDFFFKNPEAMAKQSTTGIPGMFWDILTRLGSGGYA